MSSERPKFLPAFLDEIKKESHERGWWAVVPFVFLLSAAASAVVAYLIPEAFWANEKWDVSTAVYAGILTFDGLVLVLGWSAFGRIYDVLLRGDFGKYLMKNDLLGSYILHITFMHGFQILAALCAAMGLVSVLIDGIPAVADRAIFALTLTLTTYAMKQAFNAVAAMNDLVWQSAFYETNKPPSSRIAAVN